MEEGQISKEQQNIPEETTGNLLQPLFTTILVVPAAFRKQLKMFLFCSSGVLATIPTISLTWTSSTETLQVHKVCWQNETLKCILEMI